MPESSDPTIDELKRKARRRLVGAVVLALAAAIFVPMLLESEQKPLGDDVAVRIPPVDDGKFVNRLNHPVPPPPAAPTAAPGSGPATVAPAAAPADGTKSDATPPGAPDTAAGAPADGTPAATTPVSSNASAATDVAVGAAAVAGVAAAGAATHSTPPSGKSLADAEQRVMGASAGTAKPAPAPKPAATAKAAPSPKDAVKTADAKPAATPTKATVSGAFVVQLAAYSDDKGANALSNRLKKSGYASYIEPVNTSHGTLWRVRVGPFASREDANAARDRLKRDGHNGLVTAKSA